MNGRFWKPQRKRPRSLTSSQWPRANNAHQTPEDKHPQDARQTPEVTSYPRQTHICNSPRLWPNGGSDHHSTLKTHSPKSFVRTTSQRVFATLASARERDHAPSAVPVGAPTSHPPAPQCTARAGGRVAAPEAPDPAAVANHSPNASRGPPPPGAGASNAVMRAPIRRSADRRAQCTFWHRRVDAIRPVMSPRR